MTYRPDRRGAADVLAEMSRTTAAAEPVPGLTGDWRALLFDGGALADPAEPSQALLGTTATLYEDLARHFSTLPERARRHWLETTLGIPALPMVPDEVVAVATAAPGAAPAVLRAGTELRAAKAEGVPERTYLTTDTLTVLGAALAAAHGYCVDAEGDCAHAWTDLDAPFAPFEGPPATHALDIVSGLLAFSGGEATVVVTFTGVIDASVLRKGSWQASTADGLVDLGAPSVTGGTVTLTVPDGCAPYDRDEPYLRVSFAGDDVPDDAYALTAKTVRVSMRRTGVRADAAYYNDGAVDVSKEFKPFGPVPRSGDSFYVRSDEALGKPLSSLSVTVDLVESATGVAHAVAFGGELAHVTYVKLDLLELPLASPSLSWQRFTDGDWCTYQDAGSTLHGTSTGSPAPTPRGATSDETQVGGTPGRYVRLHVERGDFGWDNYLTRLAQFAAAAAAGGKPAASNLIPPNPPVANVLRLAYTTETVDARALCTNNAGSLRESAGSAGGRPFRRPVEPETGETTVGTVAFGFTVAAAHLGSALSWYADVAQAPACASAGRDHAARWEYWATGGTWRRLDTLDGTHGLRQSGLVRLVTPADWADGCADVGAPTGRWLRLRTATPAFVGAVLAVHVDAVTARYAAPRPDDPGDAAPLTPLVPKQVKGTRTPVAGVKVTNPVAGVPGRRAEDDAAYAARATTVVRHRNRAVQAWDYEALVAAEFREVAVVRCLPHADAEGCDEPGSVALVVLPRSTERQPVPSVALARRITDYLAPRLPAHARPIVLCPLYEEVRFTASVVLRRGVAAAEARTRLIDAVERSLHPLSGTDGAPFGRALYASSLLAFLEAQGDVDHVVSLGLLVPSGATRVDVDPCRGLVASAGDHVLSLEEQL